MKPATLRRLHRWLGLVFSLSILMSTVSGVMHTVMTRTQPPPPHARPSGGALDPSSITYSVAEAIATMGADAREVRAVNVRSIGGEPCLVGNCFSLGFRSPREIQCDVHSRALMGIDEKRDLLRQMIEGTIPTKVNKRRDGGVEAVFDISEGNVGGGFSGVDLHRGCLLSLSDFDRVGDNITIRPLRVEDDRVDCAHIKLKGSKGVGTFWSGFALIEDSYLLRLPLALEDAP